MKTIHIDCYELETSTIDGRGVGTFEGHVKNEADAKAWCSGNHWRMYRKITKTYVICESLDELVDAQREQKKAAVLAKLTPAERELLGL